MTSGTKQTMAMGLANGLGLLVWWDLSGTQITPQALRDIFSANGFEPSRVPDIDPVAAMRDSVARWNFAGFKSEWLGANNDGTVGVGILEKVKGQKRVDRLQRVRIDFDPTTSTFAPDVSLALATDEIKGAVERFRAYAVGRLTHLDHNWIRPKFVKPELERLDSFFVKGGVYYVPMAHADTVLRIQAALGSIGNSSLSVLEVPDTEQSRAGVGGSAQAAILADFEKSVETLEKWQERMKEDGARMLRRAACTSMLREFRSMRDRAALYAGALRFKVSDIDEKIAAAEIEAHSFFTRIGALSNTPSIDEMQPGSDALTEEAAPLSVEPTEVVKAAEPVAPAPKPEPTPEPVPEPESIEYTADALGAMKRADLRPIAKDLDIKGRGRMKPDELRVAILMAQEQHAA